MVLCPVASTRLSGSTVPAVVSASLTMAGNPCATMKTSPGLLNVRHSKTTALKTKRDTLGRRARADELDVPPATER